MFALKRPASLALEPAGRESMQAEAPAEALVPSHHHIINPENTRHRAKGLHKFEFCQTCLGGPTACTAIALLCGLRFLNNLDFEILLADSILVRRLMLDGVALYDGAKAIGYVSNEEFLQLLVQK